MSVPGVWIRRFGSKAPAPGLAAELRQERVEEATVGVELAVQLTVGTLGGLWLDKRLGTTPWLMWFGIVVGVGACVRTIMRLIRGTHLNEL